MRTCTKCGIEKLESDYFFQDKAKNRLHTQCKACYKVHRKTYMHEHYMKYGDLYRERARVRKARIKRELRLKLVEYMSDKACIQCGESDICTLDFDHIDPSTKRFGIANALHHNYSWEVILTEIKKCRILCSNCHRKHTAKQFGWHKDIS